MPSTWVISLREIYNLGGNTLLIEEQNSGNQTVLKIDPLVFIFMFFFSFCQAYYVDL